MEQVSREFSIPVYVADKAAEGDFRYSKNDKVQKLQKWIAENQGIPADQQRLIVACGNKLCPKKFEITANPKDLLTRHIPKDAFYLSIWGKLRG